MKSLPETLKQLNNRLSEILLRIKLHKSKPVLRAVLRSRWELSDEQEQAQFAFIETLKQNMIQKNLTVNMIYYGVGGPTQDCSDEKIKTGITVSETTGIGIPRISSSPFKGKFLFRLIRQCVPMTVLELGTGYGISGLYQIAALNLNGKGHFYTLDASEENQEIASQMFQELGDKRWSIIKCQLQDDLPKVLEQIGRIDVVFVDADHSYTSTVRYFELLFPYITPGGILVFDDIQWSKGMSLAWKEITHDRRIKCSITLDNIGICVKT